MANNVWMRVYTEIARDRKLRRLPPSSRWVWIAILCMAKESPEQGKLLLSENIPATVDDIADEANIPAAEVSVAIEQFKEQFMLGDQDGVLTVINWDKRQFVSDNSTERWKKWKQTKTNVGSNVGANIEANVDCAPPETETYTETYTEINNNVVGDRDNETIVIPEHPETADAAADIEKEFGRALSPMETEQVAQWEQKHRPEVILEAVRIAVLKGVYNLTYIDRILLGWERVKLKTLPQVREHEKKRSSARTKAPPATEKPMKIDRSLYEI